MNIPILGMVENMSYAVCPDCGKKIPLFGESRAEEVAKEYGVPLLAKVPMDGKLTALMDKGVIELMENDYIAPAADAVEGL